MRNYIHIRHRSHWMFGVLTMLFVTIFGCQDLTSGADELPAGVPDPKALDNPAGAMAQYQAAVCDFNQCDNNDVLLAAILIGGVLTDELQSSRLGAALNLNLAEIPGSELELDARQVSRAGQNYTLNGIEVYVRLHKVRRAARLAAAALRKHGADFSPALRGHLFAIEGYAEILLADLFCSGVPLSTVDFEGDFTYAAGSTTAAVYAHAISLFDSALALSSDSVRMLNFARIGKARALLARGAYTAAAEIATTVPDGFAYQTMVKWSTGTGGRFTGTSLTVSNREGATGLPYRTSRDPRTIVVRYGTNTTTRDTLWFPAKYGTQTSVSAMTVANATEARLIEAEAALQRSDISAWLFFLNRLRTDSTWTVRPNATDPTRLDTVWNAGTGGVAGLPPLQDPGIGLAEPARTGARIDLLFAERAAWLFLTGHRQGDLRRLVRLARDGGYERAEDRVYPTGSYRGAPYLVEYGHDVDLVIPSTENGNPLFTGCQERGA